MKLFYFLGFLCVCVFNLPVYSQCPPAGFPQPGNTCPTAPILCPTLDGYCATINNNNQQQPFPGCSGQYVLNNDEWFAFFAGTTSITIEVTPSNCSSGGQQGLQGGIYNGCGGAVMDVQCACTTNPFILTSNNFVIGQIYWFVLDGCGGNVCDYSINVLDGSTVGVPPNNPGTITGPTIVCPSTNSAYNLPAVFAATMYNWTLTPAGLGTINNNNTLNPSVSWNASASGTAQLCVTAANGCYSNMTPSCISIEIIPKPTAMLSGSGLLCTGGSGSVPLSVTFTGQAPWVFVYTINGVQQPAISTSTNPYIITATQPGTYGLLNVFSATGGCPGTVSGTAAVTQTTVTATTAVTAAQCGQSNGAINLTPGGGTQPYLFIWSSGQTTEDLANVPAGSYTVTVTDMNGCTKTATATVAENSITLNVTGVIVANTTCNGGNGSIDVSVSPAGTYNYNWSNGAMTQDITNLPQGSYTVTVTAGLTCTGTATFNVSDFPFQPNISFTVTGTTCDFSNGAIDVTTTGGVSPYTFLWGGGQVTEDLSNIPAGSYSVTVTGANGCSKVANITVNNTNPPISVTGVVVANTTCNGGNGSIDVSVNPANGTYTYTWSNGAMTQDLTNLTPGGYTVTVSAGGSCTQTASFNIADNPNPPIVTSTQINTTCDFSNGNINVTASGGVAPYTFLWAGGQTTEDLTNMPAGSYSVTVTGANGCTKVANMTLTNTNPPIGVSGVVLANTTCTGSNGSIDVSVNPAGTYTYTWSTGAMTQDVSGLPGGTYTVTVSAGGSCTNTASFTIADSPNVPVVNATVVNTTCDLSNGSIALSVSGGVTPYMYLWSTGATTVSVTNLLAGGYSVTVTGANGCSTVANYSVVNNNAPITVNATILPNTSCNSMTNGSINISVSPFGTYTYLWSNGAMTQNINGLASGTYTVTVNGGGTCTQTASFTVADVPNAPTLSFTTVTATCGLSNGSINMTVFGGVQPFTYLWSNGQTIQDPVNVPGDNYSVTVTGANGCSVVDGVTVANNQVPITVNAIIKNQTSCIASNGGIMLQLTPANMTVLWSNGSTATNLNNLAPGTYTVTVSAGGTCTETASYTVGDDSEAPVLTVNITPANCGLNNGAVDLEVDGGLAPYTYKWSTGSTFQDINNLLAGNYAVTVTTALGCTSVIFAPVPSEPIPIGITGVVFDNNSCSSPNGEIDIDVAPAGNAYKFKWSNAKVTEDIMNLLPGIYTVTVTYGVSCSAVASFEVLNVALLPSLSVLGIPATCGLNNGGADLTVTGGTPGYTYLWSNSATTQDLNNILPGNYTVTVKDFFDCSATATVTVANNNVPLNVTGVITPNTSCAAPNGGLNISVSPAGTYTYKWSNLATTEDLNNLAAGTYTVTVTAGASCSATATFTVTNNTADPDISPVITPAICGNSNGAINLTISGGGTPYIFIWSNMATTEDLANIPAGNYTVTVTAANGCTADTTLNVPNNASNFSLSGVAAPLTNCTAPNGAVNLTVTPAGTYTFKWSNGAITEDLNNLPAGTYTVSVTETGNCIANASFIIPDERTYPAATQTITPEVCGLSNGAINLSVSGGAPPYTFTWSSGQMTEDLNNVPAGNYTVTVTGANGCTTSPSATLPANTISFSLSATTTPSSSCLLNNGTISLDVTPAGTYTYLWSNAATTEDLGPVGGGNYTVTVSAGGTCTSTGTYNVGSAASAPSVTDNVTPASCGQSSGGINLTVFSGVAPYTYLWSNGAVTEDLSGILAGTYAVTVTGANSCTTAHTYTVPDDVIVPTISGITTPNTLCVGSDGSINLSVSPSLTYTYIWSSGQTSQNLSNIGSGDYSVTVNGGGACIGTATFTVGSNIPAPQLAGSITTAYCGQATGSVNLMVSSGISPYTYIWSNAVLSEDLNAVVAGSYLVTVTSANGCTATATYAVPDSVIVPTITGSTVTSTSCVVNNGAIDLTVTPDILTYSYIWSNSATSQDLVDIASGPYSVTVNGGGACTNTASFTVGSNTPAPQMTGNISTAFCGQSTGSINLVVDSGVAPFTFVWSTTAVTEEVNSLATGSYTVTVSSANGCTSTGTYTVPDSVTIPVITPDIVTNTSCIANNGAISLTVAPGILPYTYLWAGGQTSSNLTGLAPGPYTVTVSGGGGCNNSATITVPTSTAIVSITGVATQILCFGQNTGNIALTVTGGDAPFVYNWSPAQPGNPLNLPNLPAGNYAFTATDVNGCFDTLSFVIQQPGSAVQLSCGQSSNVSAPGGMDGAAKLAISGGVAPYTVTWSPGSTQTNVQPGDFFINNLGVGSYAATVTDANGCTTQCNFGIGLVICKTVVGTMSATALSHCGTGCVTAAYDATGQFLEPGDVLQYILHTGNGGQIQNEILRTTQPTICFDPALMTYGTTYYVSVAAGNDDGSGNIDLIDFCTVVAPGTPILFTAQPVVAIAPPANLSCVLKQVPLTGSSTVTSVVYAWTTIGGQFLGSTSQATATAVAAGTYTLIVNNNGCADTSAVLVKDLTNNPQATILANPGDLLDCTIDEIILSGTAEGTVDANAIWISNGVFYASGTVIPITTPGTYEFIILDTLSFCSDTANIFIDQDQAYPPLFIQPPGILTCIQPTATLSGGSPFPGIQFQWVSLNNSDTTTLGTGNTLAVSTPGIYYLIGSDPANQCSNILNATVIANQTIPVADAGPPFSIACFGEVATLDGSGSTSGGALLNFLWSTTDGSFVAGKTTPTVQIDEPGQYFLLVTNPTNGCTDTDEVLIDPRDPIAKAVVRQPNCFGEKGSILIDTVAGGKPPFTYSMDGGQHYTPQNFFPNLEPGAYSILVLDANGCAATFNSTIVAALPFEITLEPKALIALGESYQIEIEINSPLNVIVNVQWTPSTGLNCDTCLNPIATPLMSTQYKVVVANDKGCTDNAALQLRVDRRVDVYIPNIFSPNGDGENDVFLIFANLKGVKEVKSFQVFDRWGEAVFQYYDFLPNNPAYGWDGNLNGQVMNPAVFVWYAVIELVDGSEVLYEGDVTLER